MRYSLLYLLCATFLSGEAFAAKTTPDKEVVLGVANPDKLPAAETVSSSKGIVTLDEAIEKAFASSPKLKSAVSTKFASKGALRQAGALPNPEISVEAENIGGKNEYKGFDSAEITYGVSQLVEIGGKRSARKDAASQEYEIASFGYLGARLDIIRDVSIAYAEAVATKEEVRLAEKQKSLAKEILENVTRRVDAAAEPLFQKNKSEVAVASSEIALEKAKHDYLIAAKQLAALWGSDDTGFQLDSTYFAKITAPASLIDKEAIKNNPDFIRLEAELARSRANLDLEKASAIPDPSVNVGLKNFRDTGDRAFVAGLSIPIPVFNLNRGNIAKARHEVNKTESDKVSAEIGLGTDLLRSQQELENSYRQAQSLKSVILPSAEKAYTLSQQGYKAGKFPYLEVLDAQRTLVEARAQYNNTLKEYHIKRAEVERLTAKHLPALNSKDKADAQ